MKHFNITKVKETFVNHFDGNPLFASLLNYSLVKLSQKERPLLLFHNMEIVWSNLYILQQIIFVYEKSTEIDLVVKNKKVFYKSLIVAVLISLLSFGYTLDKDKKLIELPSNKINSYFEGLRLLKMIDEKNSLELDYDLIKSVFVEVSEPSGLQTLLFKFLYETSVSFYGVPVRTFQDKRLAVSGIVYSISLELERQINRAQLLGVKNYHPSNPLELFKTSVANYSAYLNQEAIFKIRKIVNNSYLIEFSQVGVVQDIFENHSYAILRKVDELSDNLSIQQKAEIGKRYQSLLLKK